MTSTTYFDEILYLQEARKAGISQEAAEVQAKHIRIAFNDAVKTAHDELTQRDLASDQDVQITEQKLELKIEQVRADLSVKIEQARTDLSIKIEQVRADLGIKIEQSKNSLMLWIFSLLAAYSGILITLMGRGFHWW